jgi:hypothetical protein
MVRDCTDVMLYVMNAHTKEDYKEDILVEEHCIKFLSHQQKILVASAVKGTSIQTARQLLQNLDGSPKVIDRSLSKSVARFVGQKRKFFTAIALEGVEVSNFLDSLAQSAEVLWINSARKLHKPREIH